MYHSHRPKEKLRPDSNNNENSVPKDFDNVDSNSNLGARSQRRLPVTNGKRKLDKAKAQSMLEKSANEVLKYPPVQPRGTSHNHSRAFVRKPHPQVPTVSAPVQGSNQDPPFYQEQKVVTELPAGSELRREQPQCEISGKEAISALSRAKSRECRQQIVEVYCKHKDRALMPEKVPRYCPTEGELHRRAALPVSAPFPVTCRHPAAAAFMSMGAVCLSGVTSDVLTYDLQADLSLHVSLDNK